MAASQDARLDGCSATDFSDDEEELPCSSGREPVILASSLVPREDFLLAETPDILISSFQLTPATELKKFSNKKQNKQNDFKINFRTTNKFIQCSSVYVITFVYPLLCNTETRVSSRY